MHAAIFAACFFWKASRFPYRRASRFVEDRDQIGDAQHKVARALDW